jgi:tRNA pseudouridine13 synthase
VSKWTDEEGVDAREARQKVQQRWVPKEALGYFPQRLHIERKILEYLRIHPGEYCQAFSVLPVQLRKMYVHAIQSYLFNRFLSLRLRLNLPFFMPVVGDLVASVDERGLLMKILTTVSSRNLQSACNAIKQGKAAVVGPLIGHHAKIPDNEWGEQIRSLLKEEKISLDMFKVPGCAEFASAGSSRRIIMPLNNLEYSIDETTNTHPMVTLCFDLQKGSYATVVLREVMKTAPQNYV